MLTMFSGRTHQVDRRSTVVAGSMCRSRTAPLSLPDRSGPLGTASLHGGRNDARVADPVGCHRAERCRQRQRGHRDDRSASGAKGMRALQARHRRSPRPRTPRACRQPGRSRAAGPPPGCTPASTTAPRRTERAIGTTPPCTMAPGSASNTRCGGQSTDTTPKTSGNQIATPTGHPIGENFTIHSVDGRNHPSPTITPVQNRCRADRPASSIAHSATPTTASGHQPHGGIAKHVHSPATTRDRSADQRFVRQ